jgi:DNA-binding transcriptional ArsR family regulator
MINKTYDPARFFKALGDETRLRLVALLAQQEPGNALCVGRLASELETTMSNVSQHLRVLKDLGLVRGQRRGYRIHYFLDQTQLVIMPHGINTLDAFLAKKFRMWTARSSHPHLWRTYR